MAVRALLVAASLLAIASTAGAQTAPISGLPTAATPLTGSELIPCVQGGSVKQCSASSLGSAMAGCSPSSTCSVSGAWSFSDAILTGGSINGTPIGQTTPAAVAATTLSASGAVSGAGFANYLASPPAIGGTTPGPVSASTLSASGAVTLTQSALLNQPCLGTNSAGVLGAGTCPGGTGASTSANNTWTGSNTFNGGVSVKGVTNGTTAAAGNVQEYPAPATFASVTVATASANMTSMSLTAGDWEVAGGVVFSDVGNQLNNCAAGFSTTSASYGAAGTYSQLWFASGGPQTLGEAVPSVRLNLAATTTVYFVGACSASGGTPTASGQMRATRVY
jgi:hypothetical protein